jgi:PqqD family protein of HPr-rel-A system
MAYVGPFGSSRSMRYHLYGEPRMFSDRFPPYALRMEPSDSGRPEASVDTLPHVELGYVPRQRFGVLELDMEGGVILYDDGSSLVHRLSPSASIVWKLCQGDASLRELTKDVAEAFGLDPSETEEQLSTTIAELDALGLVEDSRPGEQGERADEARSGS